MANRTPTSIFGHKKLAPLVLGLVVVLTPLASVFAANSAQSKGASPPALQSGPSEKEYSPEVIRRASSIARQTMSPFCPGRTLSDCPSEFATEWRSDIREMVAQGLSAEEIQSILEKRAGGNLSGIPNRESSYVLPIAFSLAAGLVLYFVFALLRRPERTTATKKVDKDSPKSTAAVGDERLEAELEDED